MKVFINIIKERCFLISNLVENLTMLKKQPIMKLKIYNLSKNDQLSPNLD